ncbi:MAG: polyribonucleotide nucleotidyltransferase [Clostridiales Family XIII bacterium]|jgi:polyribonucleotide nucleotidyltransferase|nr:polyribonucleotide nucleotidyltransferase [Clostridiales Family XIII bacterium]
MRFEDYKMFRTAVGGRLMQAEVGKVAEQANGAVTIRYGDTVVNVTACMSKSPREGIDFFPLSCDYEEKMYAAGKIPGGFIKREGRPSEKATLSARLMDRPLRPLFPKGFRNDVQIVATILCVDPDCPPEMAAMVGSSIALSISDIPFEGPTASVIVGLIGDRFIVNPTQAERAETRMSLTVSGTRDAIMMVEAGAQEVPEEKMIDAIFFAHDEIKKMIEFIDEIVAEVGKEKIEIPDVTVPAVIADPVRAYATDKMREAIHTFERSEQSAKIDEIYSGAQEEFLERFEEEYPDAAKQISSVVEDVLVEEFRGMIINEQKRPDGRAMDEIRQIWCETGFLPRTHGSALFKRGQTQALSVVTLGTLSEGQTVDGIGDETGKRYMHQYNFPPYSVGETRPMRSPGRREIGHGALAERALLPVLPDEVEFPYAIRVVSEILSSNGSSSQASVCGSTMSLMDAGVPIKAPVSGIAMGLVEEYNEQTGESRMAILSDIQGLEDHYGDMDFKVAGTREGVTALQMDIKVHGLSREILEKAIRQARDGRLHIMDQIEQEIKEPRSELSKYAPRIITIQIDVDDIRTVIGPGGKTINGIVERTGVKIDIEDTGLIYIAAPDMETAEKAVDEIETLLKDVEIGEIYEGEVKRIKDDFGAFIEVLPGKEGLLRIGRMENYRIDKIEDVMNIGDKVKVKVTEIDGQGRINLSRKELLDKK